MLIVLICDLIITVAIICLNKWCLKKQLVLFRQVQFVFRKITILVVIISYQHCIVTLSECCILIDRPSLIQIYLCGYIIKVGGVAVFGLCVWGGGSALQNIHFLFSKARINKNVKGK